MSELSSPILGQTEAETEEEEAGGNFAHPPEGEQEKSAESDETLSEDEKSD
jgi:hypothetical protein